MDNLIYLCPDYYKSVLEAFHNENTHAVVDCTKCDKNCHIESHDYVDESWFIAE